jgi:hypothetical protein
MKGGTTHTRRFAAARFLQVGKSAGPVTSWRGVRGRSPLTPKRSSSLDSAANCPIARAPGTLDGNPAGLKHPDRWTRLGPSGDHHRVLPSKGARVSLSSGIRNFSAHRSGDGVSSLPGYSPPATRLDIPASALYDAVGVRSGRTKPKLFSLSSAFQPSSWKSYHQTPFRYQTRALGCRGAPASSRRW